MRLHERIFRAFYVPVLRFFIWFIPWLKKTRDPMPSGAAAPLTDPDALQRALEVKYGIVGARADALRADLEPIFKMTGAPKLAEGTDCGMPATKRPRGPHDVTPAFPEPDAAAFGALPRVEFVDNDRVVMIADRFHDQACQVLGERRMVEIGSLLGQTLADGLYHRIARLQPNTYMLLQLLAYYRVAAAAACLETEEALLGTYLRESFQEAADWVEVHLDLSYDEISFARPAG
jgi:hypothetical protein